MNFRRLILVLLLLAASSARALTIVGYDSATNDRFTSGYSSNPVANTSPSFLGAGYDLSGVGWNPLNTTQSFAMISDRYFVYATHYGPGSSIDFFSPILGAVVNYAVSSTSYAFTYNGQSSDFRVGMLDDENGLNPVHGITSYPILDLPTVSSYLGLPVLAYGHGFNGPRLGANTVDILLPYNFPHQDGSMVNDSYGIGYAYNSSQSSDSMFEGGDSSSPTFIPWNGTLALVGTHSVIGNISGIPHSVDNFIPIYLDQMEMQGIDFSVVPEPSRMAFLLVGACALLRRRHRASSRE